MKEPTVWQVISNIWLICKSNSSPVELMRGQKLDVYLQNYSFRVILGLICKNDIQTAILKYY